MKILLFNCCVEPSLASVEPLRGLLLRLLEIILGSCCARLQSFLEPIWGHVANMLGSDKAGFKMSATMCDVSLFFNISFALGSECLQLIHFKPLV